MTGVGHEAFAKIAERVRHGHVETEEILNARLIKQRPDRTLQAIRLDVQGNGSGLRIGLVQRQERIERHEPVTDGNIVGDPQNTILVAHIGFDAKPRFERPAERDLAVLFRILFPPSPCARIFIDFPCSSLICRSQVGAVGYSPRISVTTRPV